MMALRPSAIGRLLTAAVLLVGFGVLALAYIGAKFVLEDLLGRHWG